MTRIVYANLGYLRGIDGSFRQHVGRFWRHVYTPIKAQTTSISQLTAVVEELSPDLCCLVELDRGSITNRFFDQLPTIGGKLFPVSVAHGKYGTERILSPLHFSYGKSNAFLAKAPVEAADRYLTDGKKKLVYDIRMTGPTTNLRILVVHLSLVVTERARQIEELAGWVAEEDASTIVVGDFNVFRGERELKPLLASGHLFHANRGMEPTFRFGPWRAALDTCLISEDLRSSACVTIVDQPYSDHQMLVMDV
ncbi:endonuclease/exonuclease/phosphatase family protein [Fulvimarina sp. 2208YS6-2-32]|uniref:Endonuclease/exonuclease/phosphatase family protein n=1 Tax=Fulvimarina uroteuthidis TaxID=3098149 RepID=A0ABU5HZV7_9HYPH|nr:endonuclease/exonuclease/phosphatase family protein [Fulvimarina sp. 2208YS6-2-32]MDY8108402.1 endonuclease/exonuclease/phosphatase family protein [Fulvimarina sp. 2208YS6-2-32]